MPEIDTRVMCHCLTINPFTKPSAQRKWKVDKERRSTINEEVGKLSNARFITKTKYPTWLANVVLVMKAMNVWRMCVDFTKINIAYHKDPYPLPDINRMIHWSSGYHTLSFIDAYSSYNQIQIDPLDTPKTTFMSNHDNCYYNVVHLGLKNVGATYQQLMDVVFSHHIGNSEVYVDNMIVKTTEGRNHAADLEDIL